MFARKSMKLHGQPHLSVKSTGFIFLIFGECLDVSDLQFFSLFSPTTRDDNAGRQGVSCCQETVSNVKLVNNDSLYLRLRALRGNGCLHRRWLGIAVKAQA
jgi:hypothetical protein